jgi:undecaprenyl-diphosphatase
MANFIVKLDQALILAIHRRHSLKRLDRLFAIITILGSGIFSFPFTILCLFLNWRLGILLFITLSCCFLTVQFLKYRFLRWRPYYGLIEIKWQRKKEAESSFPSGHSAAVFAMATCLNQYLHAPFSLFLIASFVGYSRVQLGDHYPSDVVCGAILGFSIALFVLLFL